MSGDVQPRKRKDKRKKKEGGSLGMIHDPVSSHKFRRSESEDRKVFDLPEQGEKIHVQSEHGVGGNICVKIVFFCLLGLLVGAVGLIYMKSQGSSDVDLPTIEESRFADYFTGWLDDSTDEHENEHVTSENNIYHDHDEHNEHDDHDDHEEVERNEENENEEDDQSAEQDAIYKLFGLEDDAGEEVEESSLHGKAPESEESGIERDVDEDEEDGDGSEELKEEEEDEVNEEDESGEVNEDGEEHEDEKSGEGNEEDEPDEEKEKDEGYEDEDSDEVKEEEKDEEDNSSAELEQQDEEDDNEISEEKEDDNYDTSPDKKHLPQMDEDEDDDEESEDIGLGKAAKKTLDTDDNDEDNDKQSKEEDSNENDEEEEAKTDDDLGYEEIDVSEEDLDEDSMTEPEGVPADESKEEEEKLFFKKTKELKSENVESEITKEEEETEFDTGGVAIKLGVGIALIIVAHLVLVQKWKSVSNAASDEKESSRTEAPEEKKEIENLNSSAEPVISRRQTLVPESVLFNDAVNGEDEEDMENEDEEIDEEDEEEEEEEDEDADENEEDDLREQEFEIPKKKDWSTFNEPVWKEKPQENEDENDGDFNDNEELEEEEEEEEEEERGEDVEEEEEEEPAEDVEEEEEEDEEEDYEDYEDDENDFIKQKTPGEDVEEMSSQEELKDSPPIPPPRAHRDGRGAQDVDEDPLKHFEEFGEVEERSQDYPKEEKATSGPHSNPENEKTFERSAQEDEWSYRQELDFADEQFENNPKAAMEAYDKVLSKKPTLKRALIGRARALDHWAEKEKSNSYLKQAINAYKTLLIQHGNLLDEETYLKLAERCIERMRFAGSLVSAIEVHKALIMKYPDTPKYRNMLAVTYLMMNKIPQARVLLNETLSKWPADGFALVHYGFILKTTDGNMAEGAEKLMAGIQTKEEGVLNGMFFFHLGDALHRLGRKKEAMEWYELGAKEGLFLSKYQRSLYNVNRLKGQPWWTKEDTTYQDFFKKLEDNWREIRREGLELFNSKGINLFKEEAENLKDTGDWKQLDLYFRGKKTASCHKAPVTCSLVSSFQPAASCTRGQIKFSVMLPNTHVWPHCGPTNCRLRSHLGLVVPKHTFIRVAEETRSWEEGKFIIFDDSFEHEVWHNGTGPRLVLIVDVWHPELTGPERRQLSPI